MRQAGVIAAAGIYALENNIERLADDHSNAKILARGLSEIEGIEVDPDSIETNIVFFDVTGTGMTGDAFAAAMEDKGVSFSDISGNSVRAVTHMDVDKNDVENAVALVRDLLG